MHAHVEKADGVEIQTILKITEILVPLVTSVFINVKGWKRYRSQKITVLDKECSGEVGDVSKPWGLI